MGHDLGIRVYLSSTGWSAISIELGGEEERIQIGQKSYLEHASEHGHRVERAANGGGDRHHRRTSRASARMEGRRCLVGEGSTGRR
jgi:hypothetical protein